MLVIFAVNILLALLVYFVARSLPLRKRVGFAVATFILLSALAAVMALRAVDMTYHQSEQRPAPAQTEK